MAEIKIAQDGIRTELSVDGVPMKGVMRVAVQIDPNSMPVVTLDLAAFKNALELSDARLKISGIDAPEELERAILAHLSEKYAPKVTVMVDNAIGGIASRAEVVAAMHSVRKQLATEFDRAHRYGGAGAIPVCSSFDADLTAGPMAYTVVGSLPTAEEMKPAIRSVVQAVAADLIRLPVREMTDTKPAPAGLTRTATDGERNGRMTWVPGAR
jgi:hypothetical protein